MQIGTWVVVPVCHYLINAIIVNVPGRFNTSTYHAPRDEGALKILGGLVKRTACSSVMAL